MIGEKRNGVVRMGSELRGPETRYLIGVESRGLDRGGKEFR